MLESFMEHEHDHDDHDGHSHGLVDVENSIHSNGKVSPSNEFNNGEISTISVHSDSIEIKTADRKKQKNFKNFLKSKHGFYAILN